MLADFADLLALENVTGDVPALRRNADAIVARLRARGVEAEAVGPDGVAPLVIGRVPARPGAPRLGLYAHYDGQPVTPADWATPPFEPTLVGPDGTTMPFPGRRRTRSTTSGGCTPAPPPTTRRRWSRCWPRSTRSPPPAPSRAVELVLCLEGEEESGSTHLGELMAAHADRLAADAWLICDGPVQQGNAPQVVLGVRGFTDLELTVYGPARELHSGHYGNWAPNPALELARLLASMKDAAGRVTIDGFTADTRPPTAAEQAVLDAMPPVEAGLLDRLGLAAAEVPGSRLLDRLMLPSLNVRGLRAADVGAGRPQRDPGVGDRVDRHPAGRRRRPGADAGAGPRARPRPAATWCSTGSRPRAERRGHPAVARIDARVGYPAARAPGGPAGRRPPARARRPGGGRAGARAAHAGRLGPAAPLRAGCSARRR